MSFTLYPASSSFFLRACPRLQRPASTSLATSSFDFFVSVDLEDLGGLGGCSGTCSGAGSNFPPEPTVPSAGSGLLSVVIFDALICTSFIRIGHTRRSWPSRNRFVFVNSFIYFLKSLVHPFNDIVFYFIYFITKVLFSFFHTHSNSFRQLPKFCIVWIS